MMFLFKFGLFYKIFNRKCKTVTFPTILDILSEIIYFLIHRTQQIHVYR